MNTVATEHLTLEAFLDLPETKPASEFVDGEISQKPMPQGEHSRLQVKLCPSINQMTEAARIAYAFSELRCTYPVGSRSSVYGGRSLVSDVAVFHWAKIPVNASGRIENRFFIPPDWAIEILSPDHSQTKVLDNLLHCSEHGTELGWLLDPAEESVLVVLPEQRVRLLRGDTELPVLGEIELTLTVQQVFAWLML